VERKPAWKHLYFFKHTRKEIQCRGGGEWEKKWGKKEKKKKKRKPQTICRFTATFGCSYSISVYFAQGCFCSLASLDCYISKVNSAGPLPGFPYPSSLRRRASRQVSMPRLFPFQPDQRSSSWESQSHSPLPRLSNTVAFKLHVSCLAEVIFTLLQDTLQATERKRNIDLQQLNFWLDRRFGSLEGFSALTWFQHLPENRFSIHFYPLL